MQTIDRYRGALLGLAAGDALGTTLEFTRPGAFTPISDMVGGGPFHLQPGQWSDDTSMALCLAESLLERSGFDPVDQLTRYCRWHHDGYLASTGSCFDIGQATEAALRRFEQTHEPFPGTADPGAAGNGSLMRLAPVPLYFAGDPATAIRLAARSSYTTHGSVEAADACRYFAGLLIGALQDRPKAEVLAPDFSPVPDLWSTEPLAPRIAEVAAGSFIHKEPPAIRGKGYVVPSLETALWAFSRSSSFRDGALLAVNLGEDADTTGAIYGQLAGVYYGETGIPASWRARLALHARIVSLADGLWERGGKDG